MMLTFRSVFASKRIQSDEGVDVIEEKMMMDFECEEHIEVASCRPIYALECGERTSLFESIWPAWPLRLGFPMGRNMGSATNLVRQEDSQVQPTGEIRGWKISHSERLLPVSRFLWRVHLGAKGWVSTGESWSPHIDPDRTSLRKSRRRKGNSGRNSG